VPVGLLACPGYSDLREIAHASISQGTKKGYLITSPVGEGSSGTLMGNHEPLNLLLNNPASTF
jgi:hypothetical protein